MGDFEKMVVDYTKTEIDYAMIKKRVDASLGKSGDQAYMDKFALLADKLTAEASKEAVELNKNEAYLKLRQDELQRQIDKLQGRIDNLDIADAASLKELAEIDHTQPDWKDQESVIENRILNDRDFQSRLKIRRDEIVKIRDADVFTGIEKT